MPNARCWYNALTSGLSFKKDTKATCLVFCETCLVILSKLSTVSSLLSIAISIPNSSFNLGAKRLIGVSILSEGVPNISPLRLTTSPLSFKGNVPSIK